MLIPRLRLLVALAIPCAAAAAQSTQPASLADVAAAIASEGLRAYEASPYSILSKDYFARFSRDPAARPAADETEIAGDWTIRLPRDGHPQGRLMAGYLATFLARMGLDLAIQEVPREGLREAPPKSILLLDADGGDERHPESFTIVVEADRVIVHGRDPNGLRDGIVRLADHIGLRQAPCLARGRQTYRPRLSVRLGAVPWLGTHRDLVFLGYNAVFVSGGSLFALSRSDAIPELVARRQPGLLESLPDSAAEARRHGLKTFCFVDIRQKFDRDDPVFLKHPEIRGALTWKADGQYVLCTEHPLVRRWLTESVEGIFRADPQLDGLVLIIGGEGFYHCFMRPYGVEKGHTNCRRCEKLGAERVVANLCNALAQAARRANPKAQIVVWPYSAEHVWSADRTQEKFIGMLGPGVALFTEIEKDEYVPKADGVNKHLWDYSIDLIGPGQRCRGQIAACRRSGIPIYIKSEPELGFEAPRLPHIPCLDRWFDRAEALAACGADGAWVFPAFRPCYGTSAAEVAKHAWWSPSPDRDELLRRLAARIAGPEAAGHLRAAWRAVSEAIGFSPVLPPYYTGPHYLGAAHPMCANPQAEVPAVFHGRYFFMAEATDADGLALRPTYVRTPPGDPVVFGRFYRKMEELLAQAVAELDKAAPAVPQRCRLTFEAEVSPTRWFYHTVRTQANFCESCRLRDRLLALAERAGQAAAGREPTLSAAERAEAQALYERWQEVLRDERRNAIAALAVMEADVRLDFRYGGDHSFSHGSDMIREKIRLLDEEIGRFLPQVAAACDLPATASQAQP